jgi:hypothetical protein
MDFCGFIRGGRYKYIVIKIKVNFLLQENQPGTYMP